MAGGQGRGGTRPHRRGRGSASPNCMPARALSPNKRMVQYAGFLAHCAPRRYTWVLYQVRCETQRLAEALAICRLLESGSKAEPVSMCGRMLVPSLMPLWMNQISVTCARKP